MQFTDVASRRLCKKSVRATQLLSLLLLLLLLLLLPFYLVKVDLSVAWLGQIDRPSRQDSPGRPALPLVLCDLIASVSQSLTYSQGSQDFLSQKIKFEEFYLKRAQF